MSADSGKAQALFKQKKNINFPLLSDPDHKTIEEFGAWQKKQFMGRTFMGIVRSSFLIGKDGKIEEVWERVTAKGRYKQENGRCRCQKVVWRFLGRLWPLVAAGIAFPETTMKRPRPA